MWKTSSSWSPSSLASSVTEKWEGGTLNGIIQHKTCKNNIVLWKLKIMKINEYNERRILPFYILVRGRTKKFSGKHFFLMSIPFLFFFKSVRLCLVQKKIAFYVEGSFKNDINCLVNTMWLKVLNNNNKRKLLEWKKKQTNKQTKNGWELK